MLSILAQLPRTVVAVLQPQDFTRYQLVRDRGLLCDLLLTNSCPCLFRGDTRRNTRRLRALLARYRTINTQLAGHFSAGDFAVEVKLLWISTRVLLRVLDPHIFLWTRNPGRVLEL